MKHLEKAVQLKPQSAEYQSGLGDALRQTGEYSKAIEHYQTAIQLKSDFMPAYTNLAQAYNLADRSQDAIATAEKGIEVAHATGQQAASDQLDQWLTHYKIELERAHDANSSVQPAPAVK